MAGITMAEASKLIHSPLKKGVIETIVRENAIFEFLPFENINGASMGFTREENDGGVGFRDVNEGYTHENPKYSNHNVPLKRLGGYVRVDRFFEETQNIMNVRAEHTSSKAKAIANEFVRTFLQGDTNKDAQSFDGLDQIVPAENVVDAKGDILSPTMMSYLHDLPFGEADVFIMNKTTRRGLTKLFAIQKAVISVGQDTFGRQVQMFAGKPIIVVEDEFISDNAIYAVNFDCLKGIQNGELQAVDNGLRGTTYETLIEWYVSLVAYNPKGIAKLVNAFTPK